MFIVFERGTGRTLGRTDSLTEARVAMADARAAGYNADFRVAQCPQWAQDRPRGIAGRTADAAAALFGSDL